MTTNLLRSRRRPKANCITGNQPDGARMLHAARDACYMVQSFFLPTFPPWLHSGAIALIESHRRIT